jgi:hypothetical protein
MAGTAAALGCLAGATARADGLYRWTAANGTVSYTDDVKRIPERYRDHAEHIDRSTLGDYKRFTPTDAAASDAQAKQLATRLESLRAMNAVGSAAAPVAAPPAVAAGVPTVLGQNPTRTRRTFVDAFGNATHRYYTQDGIAAGTPTLPVDPNDPHPVVTELQHLRAPGETVTQTYAITRQGDRVLSIVQQGPMVYHRTDYDDLEDVENQAGE